MKVGELRPRERKEVFMSCSECGAWYSANADDYEGLHDPDVVMTCCGKDLQRIKKKMTTVPA